MLDFTTHMQHREGFTARGEYMLGTRECSLPRGQLVCAMVTKARLSYLLPQRRWALLCWSYGLDGLTLKLISARPVPEMLCHRIPLAGFQDDHWLLKSAYKATFQVQHGVYRLCLELGPGWIYLHTCSLVWTPLRTKLLEWGIGLAWQSVSLKTRTHTQTHTPSAWSDKKIAGNIHRSILVLQPLIHQLSLFRSRSMPVNKTDHSSS